MGKLKGIRERGDKWFVDVSRKGKRLTATVDTFEEAVAKRAELQIALETGQEIKQTRANAATWTLEQGLTAVLSVPKPEGWRGISYEKQATLNVEDAMKFMGPDIKLDKITRDLIDAWLHSCEAKGNSDSTINRKVSALSKVLKMAVDRGGLAALPKMPRQRKERVGRIRFISDAEEAAMAKWCQYTCETDDFWDALCVLIDTGMRRGELLNLRPVDVDLKTGVIMVYGTEGKGTKNGSIRSVPMTKRVKRVMERQTNTTSAVVFDLSESYLRHTWDAMRAYLNLSDDKDFVLHVCRHTCASRLVKAGVSLPVVQTWMGHSNIQTTMRYAHLFPQDLMNAAKALEGDRA
jgi:integrase